MAMNSFVTPVLASDFDRAIEFVLDHEGVYAEDHAGPTKYGITLATLRALGDLDDDEFVGDVDCDGDVDREDIRRLTREDAKGIYHRQWWMRYGYSAIINDRVAAKVLDLSVNMGPRRAHLLVQQALRACSKPVQLDGILGHETIGAINAVVPERVLCSLRSEAAGFYRLLVHRRPERGRYLSGWLNRAYA